MNQEFSEVHREVLNNNTVNIMSSRIDLTRSTLVWEWWYETSTETWQGSTVRPWPREKCTVRRVQPDTLSAPECPPRCQRWPPAPRSRTTGSTAANNDQQIDLSEPYDLGVKGAFRPCLYPPFPALSYQNCSSRKLYICDCRKRNILLFDYIERFTIYLIRKLLLQQIHSTCVLLVLCEHQEVAR